jgi:hypothetical protein
MTTAAVPTAAVVAVVDNNCNNGKDGSGIDGGGDDCGCGDGECNCGSGGNGDSNGSGKVTTIAPRGLKIALMWFSTKVAFHLRGLIP